MYNSKHRNGCPFRPFELEYAVFRLWLLNRFACRGPSFPVKNKLISGPVRAAPCAILWGPLRPVWSGKAAGDDSYVALYGVDGPGLDWNFRFADTDLPFATQGG